MSEISPNKCNRCGAPLPTDSPEGLCPRCLVALNLATQTEMTGEAQSAKPPPLPIEEVAKLFPQLEILECLGRGGMGAVYKTRQPRLDRIVALKILSPEKQGEPKFAERFEREARALAKLHHPNIVTVYDFGETQGNFYLLMEFVDGLTLRQLLQTRKLSSAEALGIVPKICEALQYAHEQGIVHRDIKPENILLDKNGKLKIADFGIAKILGDNGRENLTAKQVVGTPHYMSPEQIEKPQTVDHRADIYSLGVVFYEMLTGELPLGKFSPPSAKVQIDVRLDEIVLRALEKEPERRYQQVSEVKTQVETIAATSDSGRSRGNEAQTEGRKSRADWKSMSLSDIRAAREVGGFLKRIFLGVSFGLLALLLVFLVFAFYQRAHRASFNAVKSDYIGQMWFPLGDQIEITSVERSENQMIVKGRYNLVSHDQALLGLYVTTTNSATAPTDSKQQMPISKGNGDFELTDPHLASGLPHISMYADGRSFAALYFGNKQEAAEERQANWITNEASASTGIWSPAPDEKADLQKIYYSAKNLAEQGNYEEALQRYLWYFDHSRTNDSQEGVRLSFALSDWIELGRLYPKARQALIEIRDNDVHEFSEGRGDFKLFMEVNSISHYLGDDDAAYSLFKQIEQRDQPLAQQCFRIAEDLLLKHGDYQKCLDYIGDPQAAFEKIQNEWKRMKQFEEQSATRNDEQRKRLQEMAKTNSAFAHPFPKLPKFADENFVKQTRELIEVLVATGHKADAEKIRDEAVALLADPWLKSAVDDMERKLQNPKTSVDPNTGLPTMVGGTIKINPATGLPMSPGQTEEIDPNTWLSAASVAQSNESQILADQPPVIVETFPISGTRDVEPGEMEIRVRFNKEMTDNSWSWSSAWDNSTPEFIGQPHYEADGKTCVAKVKLEPNKTYAFWLNSENFHNFKDAAGQAAVPYLLIFQTKQN
ncbi:MAG: protein kinase [Limisphaerales bacterium]